MGGACGSINRKITKRAQPKRIIVKSRQITVSKGIAHDADNDKMDPVWGDNTQRSASNDGSLDFDAHVGVWFMK